MSLEGVALERVSLEGVALERMSLERVALERMSLAERMSPHVKFPFLMSRQRRCGWPTRARAIQEGRYASAMNEVTQKGQQEADMS